MLKARDAVFWVNDDLRMVMVWPHWRGCPADLPDTPSIGWRDPIGAAYTGWQEASDAERAILMLETVIELAARGHPIKDVLTAFAEVAEFKALGQTSYPMCRALKSALVGRPLEPGGGMGFDELLVAYTPKHNPKQVKRNP
jgi:hypothetical protein